MSATSRFSDAFDSANKSHVLWLKKFFDFATNLATARKSVDDFINSNPMGVKLSKEEMLEWVHVHFSLSMKYARDVLNSRAYVPE